MVIPDPGSEFSHPGSRVKKAPDPGPQIRIQVFLTHKIFTKLSENYPDVIPDLDFVLSRIRILVPWVRKVLDPGSGSATLIMGTSTKVRR
jgi:hypothetical protein